MTLFTFFLCDQRDFGTTLEAFELADLKQAALMAESLLVRHRSATSVEVWDCDYHALTRTRAQSKEQNDAPGPSTLKSTKPSVRPRRLSLEDVRSLVSGVLTPPLP